MKRLKKFQNSEREAAINQLMGVTSDPINKYYVNTNRVHMYPRSMGFIDKRSSENTINVENQFLNPNYIDAFCEGIKVGVNIRNLNLRSSGLSTKGANQIVDALILENI